MTRYASRSLHQKLGISAGHEVALLHAPPNFVLDVPGGVVIRRRARGHVDLILGFFSSKNAVEREIVRLGKMVFPDGALWISWPKKASALRTDLDDNTVRDVALALGLVDNKVCAVDATFTALRFVWRRRAANVKRPRNMNDVEPFHLQMKRHHHR